MSIHKEATCSLSMLYDILSTPHLPLHHQRHCFHLHPTPDAQFIHAFCCRAKGLCYLCQLKRGGGTNTQRDWNREEVVLLYLKMAHWPQRPILITRLHISVAFNRLCLVYYRSTDDSTHHTFCLPSNPGCATVSQPQSRVKQIGCVTVNQLLCNAIAALGTLTLVTIQTQSNPRQAEGDQSPASKQNKIEQKEKSEHNFTTSGCVRVCRQPTDCSSSPPIKDLGAVSQP